MTCRRSGTFILMVPVNIISANIFDLLKNARRLIVPAHNIVSGDSRQISTRSVLMVSGFFAFNWIFRSACSKAGRGVDKTVA